MDAELARLKAAYEKHAFDFTHISISAENYVHALEARLAALEAENATLAERLNKLDQLLKENTDIAMQWKSQLEALIAFVADWVLSKSKD